MVPGFGFGIWFWDLVCGGCEGLAREYYWRKTLSMWDLEGELVDGAAVALFFFFGVGLGGRERKGAGVGPIIRLEICVIGSNIIIPDIQGKISFSFRLCMSGPGGELGSRGGNAKGRDRGTQGHRESMPHPCLPSRAVA